MRGMQRLDNAACISTEADHVVSGLGSDFLQDKCSWQGSMGGGGLSSSLLSLGGHQGLAEPFQTSYRVRPSPCQGGHLQP